MSTPDNILGKIGQKVGEEIKALRVSLGNSIGNINLNDITGGLNVTKNDSTGIGISTDGKGVFNTLEVSLASTLKGAVTANSTITALGAISGLRAETTNDLAVGTDATIGGALDVVGKITAGSLEVQGDTKIINTTSVEVSDNILELNKSSDDSTTATISGIEINRGITEATQAGTSEGSVFIVGTFPNEEENHVYSQIELVQVEATLNDNYVYESLELTGSGTFSAGLYQMSFVKNTEAKSASNSGIVAGNFYDGWVLKRKDQNGIYQHMFNVTVSVPPTTHALRVTQIQSVTASSHGSASATHGLFIVQDTGGTLNLTDTSNPYIHHSSRPLADGDTLSVENSTPTTFYIHKKTSPSSAVVVATLNQNDTANITLEDSMVISFSVQQDIHSAGNVSNGMLDIIPGASATEIQEDPKFIRVVDAIGVDLRSNFEDWDEATITQNLLLTSGDTSQLTIYTDDFVVVPNTSDPLVSQSVPYASATSSSVNSKAKFLWDNAGDQQKFKFLVGDDLANLSSNSLTVPDGSGVVIGTAPIGTFADFTNALATAKA